MALQIDQVTPVDLIRELSPEAISYYAHLELGDGWKTHERPTEGKFVRLGSKIFLGSTVQFGPLEWSRDARKDIRNSLRHVVIANVALNQMIKEEIEQLEVGDEKVLGMGVMLDAGSASIEVDSERNPVALYLEGRSLDFGKADEAGRLRTIEIAQQILGSSVEVI